MNIIGIDPGLDGAVALISETCVEVFDSPTALVGTHRDYLIPNMAQIIRQCCPKLAIVESVHSMPKQGVASSFSFGRGFGIWLGILAALEVPYELVSPQRWKKLLLSDMQKDKDASRVRAMQLFPAVAEQLKRKKDDGRAEALLLAEYGRRIANQGPLNPLEKASLSNANS